MKNFSLCCSTGYRVKEVINSREIDLSILPLRWVSKICETVVILCTSSVAILAGYSGNSLLILVWPRMGDRCQSSGLSSSLVRYSAIDLKAIPTMWVLVISLLPVFSHSVGPRELMCMSISCTILVNMVPCPAVIFL